MRRRRGRLPESGSTGDIPLSLGGAGDHGRRDCHVSPLMRGVDEFALEVRHLHLGVADIIGRNFEQVAIQNDDLRRLAGLDGAGVLFQLQRARR